MPGSFKLKLALYSVPLFGVLLTGYCVYFLRMAYRVGLERTDAELRASLGDQLRHPRQIDLEERVGDRMASVGREVPGRTLVFRMTDYDGNIMIESGDWPKGYDGEAILDEAFVSLFFAERANPNLPEAAGRRGMHPELPISRAIFETVGTYRMMAVCNPDLRVLIGMGLEPLNAEIGEFRSKLLLSAPLALLLLIGSGWLLAKLALRPVNAIVHTARKVSARHLDERIGVVKADPEFRQLIDTINEMLGRLERSFGQAARFSANAAHELKTPLTILHAQLETALRKAPDGSPSQTLCVDLLDEVQRLDGIIRNLLILAQADSGNMPLQREPLDFSAMVSEAVDDIEALDSRQRTVARIDPAIEVEGDRRMLELVMHNLVGNAVKYSLGEPPITVALKRKGEWVQLTISNRGAPILPAERERIFERFYRADSAHNRKVDGTGLGLSIAREIAQAHGGKLELIDADPAETAFRLSLPASVTSR
ncbi:sensor histidine kinase [Pontiella sp.]|uniref:sensor histidine kinase n=1 Tax=Pontiella sp. TaxID=2837462 RepID=UPI00356139A8